MHYTVPKCSTPLKHMVCFVLVLIQQTPLTAAVCKVVSPPQKSTWLYFVPLSPHYCSGMLQYIIILLCSLLGLAA